MQTIVTRSGLDNDLAVERRMWANTVWGLFGIAFGLVVAALTAPDQRSTLLKLATVSLLVGVIVLVWPYLTAVSRAISTLTVDERYMMAV
jgi:hypothetical protein